MERVKTDIRHNYKICPVCSFFCNVKEAGNYCSFCGSKLIDKCPKCGEPISNPYAKFCKYCGEHYPGRTSETSE